MDVIRWAVSVALALLGLHVVFYNWYQFISVYCLRRRFESWIPFVGAGLLAASMLLLPEVFARRWALLPFLLDWGSVPGTLFSVGWWIWHWARKA